MKIGKLPAGLKQVMPNPVKRPAGWVSAAFEADSELPDASLCSAGYQVSAPLTLYLLPPLFPLLLAVVPADFCLFTAVYVIIW